MVRTDEETLRSVSVLSERFKKYYVIGEATISSHKGNPSSDHSSRIVHLFAVDGGILKTVPGDYRSV